MREVIHAYQTTVAAEITRLDGHVAKFMGDGVLAYFGWPVAHEDEPERAVRAGLAATAAVARLTAPGGGPLAARVGIATGLVVVGDLVGEGAAQEEAVVGETPNLAARLQALAEPGTVVVAAARVACSGRLFDLADLGAPAARRLCRRRSPPSGWRRRSDREPLRGPARPAPDPAGRARARARPPARPLAPSAGAARARSCCSSASPASASRAWSRPCASGCRRAAHALRYFCSPYHRNTAFHPILDQIERAARLRPRRPAGRQLDKLEALLARAVARPRGRRADRRSSASPPRAATRRPRSARKGARPSCRRSGSSSWSAWPPSGRC